jgi:hypothetical protein
VVWPVPAPVAARALAAIRSSGMPHDAKACEPTAATENASGGSPTVTSLQGR